jgi:D-lactate dehydrogenase (cytochrome)
VGKRASSTKNGSAALSFSRFKLVVPLALVTFSLTTDSTAHQQQQLQKEQQHSSADISVFVAEMGLLLGEENVETDLQELMQRGKPWNSYHKIDNHPGVIVFPQSTEDVSAILKACSKHGVRVVPFGGGTSIEGQTLAMEGGCSLDFNRMKSVLELNEGDLDVRVQAGLGYLELNELLREKGFWFPLDPGPGASIGGMCACRCSGSTAVKYGSMRENVLNVTAVLADGTIIKTGSRARKSSAGYDVTRLLVGSEGTLAVITEATLKIHRIPPFSYALRVTFPSVFAAAAAARDTINSGTIQVGRCEMCDVPMVETINFANPNMAAKWPERVTLLYELTGPSRESVLEQIDIVKTLARKHGGDNFSVATTDEETKDIWKLRKEALWSVMSRYPDKEPMITDVCVPLTQLPLLIASTRAALDASWLPAPIVAHAGDGNFHCIIMFNPNDSKDVAEAKRLAKSMALEAISLGGTCTGEHGVGVGKKELLQHEMGPGTMAVMQIIKRGFDPQGILNPGKILDVDVEIRVKEGKRNSGLCS